MLPTPDLGNKILIGIYASAVGKSLSNLLDAVGPSLFNSVFGPHIMCILGQFIDQNLLTRIQLDVTEFQWCRLVPVWHNVAAGDEEIKFRLNSLEKGIDSVS